MKGSNENTGVNYYELGPNEKGQFGVMDQNLPVQSRGAQGLRVTQWPMVSPIIYPLSCQGSDRCC